MVSGLAISFSHSSSGSTQGAHHIPPSHHSPLTTSCTKLHPLLISLWNGPTFFSTFRASMAFDRLAGPGQDTKTNTLEKDYGLAASIVLTRSLPSTVYRSLTPKSLHLLASGWISGLGYRAARQRRPEESYPGACLSIYRVFELLCTPPQRFCHNFTEFAITTLRLQTRFERVANSRWDSYY